MTGQSFPGVITLRKNVIYQIDDFIEPGLSDRYLRTIFQAKDQFVPAVVSTEVEAHKSEYRSASVLYNPMFGQTLEAIITGVLPEACERLEISEPVYRNIDLELQVTAHGNGCYYKTHNDNGSPDTCKRVLSYVYYLHRQPKSFTGGELKVYGTTETITVEPDHNKLVFFKSHLMHEVLPITCGENFIDSRFTVNGWIRF